MHIKPSDSGILLLVTRNGLGDDPPELQQKLAYNYFNLLNQSNLLPAAICFYTDGVKLCTEGSPVLEVLANLEKKEVRLILCSTCLEFFNLRDKVRVGIVSGMGDIIEAQWKASKVICI